MIPKTIKQIKYNFTPCERGIKDIQYIVVHYTANYEKYADDSQHFIYFNSANRSSSADFFIDKNSYMQINDYLKGYTWQCGDGKGKYGITNKNSIGVEICVNDDIEKSISNTIDVLQNDILPKFPHIDYKHLVRHYDASRKLCPLFFVNTEIKEVDPRWIEFKDKVFNKKKIITDDPVVISGINIAFTKGYLTDKTYWLDKAKKDKDITWLFTKMSQRG